MYTVYELSSHPHPTRRAEGNVFNSSPPLLGRSSLLFFFFKPLNGVQTSTVCTVLVRLQLVFKTYHRIIPYAYILKTLWNAPNKMIFDNAYSRNTCNELIARNEYIDWNMTPRIGGQTLFKTYTSRRMRRNIIFPRYSSCFINRFEITGHKTACSWFRHFFHKEVCREKRENTKLNARVGAHYVYGSILHTQEYAIRNARSVYWVQR